MKRWLSLLILLAGCSSMEQMLVDAKAYFNTFYNLQSEFNKGEYYYNLGQYIKAKSHYMKVEAKGSRILQLHRDSRFVDDAIYMMAVSYSRLRSYTKAEKKFREFFTYFPSSPLRWKVYLEYGIMLYDMKRYDEAERYLRRALESGDRRVKYRTKLYLAKILIEEKDYEQAISILEDLLRENRDNRELILTAADVYLKLGDTQRARELIQEYISDPRISDSLKNSALRLLAIAYVKEGNYDEAYNTLESMVVRDSTPQYFAIRLEMGKLLLMKGDTQGAKDIFQYISEVSKDTAKFYSYYYLGLIEESRGNFEGALGYYEDASKMGLRMAQERKETLIKIKSVEKETDPVKIYRVAEIMYLNMHKPDITLDMLRKVLEHNPPPPLEKKTLLFMTYIFANDMDMPDSARHYLQMLRQKYPSSIYARIGETYLSGVPWYRAIQE